MKILIGSDHAGFELKNNLKQFLIEKGYEVKDYGPEKFDENDDYPTILAPIGLYIAEHPDEPVKAIILGGSGQGEAMIANRFPGVRATVYYGGNLEIIKLSQLHNNANVLALGARFLTAEQAREAVALWLETKFQNEERHQRRNDLLDNFE